MARKTVTIVKPVIVDTFAADKAQVVALFQSAMTFDWNSVKTILVKYQGNEARYSEIKLACAEYSIGAYLTKIGCPVDATKCAEIAKHDARVKGEPLPDTHKDARKAAANAWFYFTTKAGIQTQSKVGGAHNKTGANGSTPKPKAATSDAPVAVQSIVVDECSTVAALVSHYDAIKHHLIKLQARNAKAYTGDEGAKVLNVHSQIVALLNTLKA